MNDLSHRVLSPTSTHINACKTEVYLCISGIATLSNAKVHGVEITAIEMSAESTRANYGNESKMNEVGVLSEWQGMPNTTNGGVRREESVQKGIRRGRV